MREIVRFHIYNYEDQNRCGKNENIIAAARVLIGDFKNYTEYVNYCHRNEIAAVTEGTWVRCVLSS